MLLKKKLSLIKSMPNIALHDTHGYNLVDLFAHQQQCQIATLTHLLNSYSKAGDIYRLRMKILQQDLWIPFSPIGIIDWSPWFKSPQFIRDIIARSLHMAATLNISFNKHSHNDLLIKGGSTPLIHILKETYPKASDLLKRRNLIFLSQVVDEDGEHLLTNQLIAHRWQYKLGKKPSWLSFLELRILKAPNSRKLKDEWLVDKDTIPFVEPCHIDVLPTTHRKKDWVISYDTNNSYLWGRTYRKQSTKFTATIEHWLQDLSSLNNETPHSKAVRLIPCTGCTLNTVTSIPKSGKIRASCMMPISLHRSIRLPSLRPPRPLTHIDFRISRNDCESRVRRYANRLAITPDFSPALIDSVLQDSSSSQLDESSHYENNQTRIKSLTLTFASYNELIFYSDGSMSHAGSTNLKMGYGWIGFDSDMNQIDSFYAGTNLWPSSTRAEISALLSILLVIPIKCSIQLYTDSDNLIQGLKLLLNNRSKFIASKLRLNNYVLWDCIEGLITRKFINIITHKVI